MNRVYISTQQIQMGKPFLQLRDLTAVVAGRWTAVVEERLGDEKEADQMDETAYEKGFVCRR